MQIFKDEALKEKEQSIGFLLVKYPDRSEWNTEAFYALADEVVASLKRDESGYNRKEEFGDTDYFRYFKKFKKTYPVLLQYESFAMKGREFPKYNPVVEVPFLMEVKTMVLSGCHDIDKVQGDLHIYCPAQKEDFTGLRGEVCHTYPGEVAGRDDGGIILSMVAGADDRTCGKPDSRNVFYPLFGTPGQDPSVLREAADLLQTYIKVLAPGAQMEYVEV